MSSLSLARRAWAGFEGDFQEHVGLAAIAFPSVTRRRHHFLVAAASGFWPNPGFRVRSCRAKVGDRRS